ncbi:unnamed protein product [Urochloa decumbens]|uniref:Uncharacterized protein n=1 Tax=Urochloa decumbens TaxID=240449 RepID=A0ABC8YQ62_9POAL
MGSSSRASTASALLLCFCTLLLGVHGGSRRLYIVYLGNIKHGHPNDVVASHHDILTTVLGSKEDSLASMVYNYKHGFSGFAAMLTEDHAKQLADSPEVISVEPSRSCRATTTRSWDFLGLDYQMPSDLLRKSKHGEDIIIGIIDTGIWPESRSFNDQGYGPVPSRWKGECVVGQGWNHSTCNRKIIGARFYSNGIPEKILKNEYLSARGYDGHGTHTASTAAGSVVEAASFHGLAAGAARGGAPRARIAVYKALWGIGGAGTSAGVLAAFDDAIHDGVDVLSLSLAVEENSFGALHAVQKGITVVYAAGNNGPRPQTVENTSPWVITVAASKIDRSFPTVITLGNKQQIVVHDTNSKPRASLSLWKATDLKRMLPILQGQSLYYQGKNSSTSSFTRLINVLNCGADVLNALNGTDLQGITLYCSTPVLVEEARNPLEVFQNALQVIKMRKGSGLIFALFTLDVLEMTSAYCQGIPCVLVDFDTGKQIAKYEADDSSPMVKIEPARSITGKEILAPKVASFSSRGPSADYPYFLKPDIAAPGASILAAKRDSYDIESGTSMATPHVAGIVALLKALHPNWSPAALKSAMVTIASVTDEYGMPVLAEGLPRKIADPFDYGGGNVNPNKAADPGLIYDISPSDYNYFFNCAIKKSVECNATSVPGYLLNLPSISVPDLRYPVNIPRTITNVGEVDAVYHVAFQSPLGVKMNVEPSVLVFNTTNKVHTFHVKLSPLWKRQGDYTFGSLTWCNNKRTVRIPIAIRITIHDFFADVA